MDILRIVLASAGVSVGAGIVAGLVLSLGVNKLTSRWLEGSAHDPLILLAVSGVLVLVCLVACLFPARRASSVDPMVALRCD
jgi:ABC-type antimicrobial peptide transport system permease subunit